MEALSDAFIVDLVGYCDTPKNDHQGSIDSWKLKSLPSRTKELLHGQRTYSYLYVPIFQREFCPDKIVE
jgi:hypothetical protein